MFVPKSLRGRMGVAFLAPALLAFGALIALAYFAARETLEDEVGARLRDTALVASTQVNAGLVARFQPDNTRTHANLLRRLETVAEATRARRVFLIDLQGHSLVDTASDAPAPGQLDRSLAEDRYELDQVGRGEAAASTLYTALDGARYKRGYAPVVNEGEVVAVLGVEGSASNYTGLDTLRTYLVAVGVFALGALALMVIVFSRALTAPLAKLAQAASRIGAGDLKQPIEIRGEAAELQVLGRTMDEMRDALLQRDRELQMMLGGIAHEVRNPLGGMELFVGLLREDLEGRDDELELLGRVELELGSLKRVVEEFLEYARRQPVEATEIPTAELLFEVAGLVDLELKCVGAEGHAVHGDRQRLRRLLLNMARNARQAGATSLTVEVVPNGLRLIDDGPGVPADKAEHIFDAFYTTKEKGTGLGLALCQRIAEQHGGRLELENPGAPGARFLLTLTTPPAKG